MNNNINILSPFAKQEKSFATEGFRSLQNLGRRYSDYDIGGASFLQYLEVVGVSKKSIKNYKSDLAHFVAWIALKLKTVGVSVESLNELVPFLGEKIANEYFDFLKSNSIPAKTINRKLSTLRQLSKFLVQSQILEADFMESVHNIPQIAEIDLLEKFREVLEKENVSANTSKNYISDVRQFLTWVQK